MNVALGFVLAFSLALCLIPLILKIANKHRLFDSVDERKIHTGEIPRLGGIGIFVAFALGILLTTLITGKGIQTGGRFLVVLLCMLVIHALGLIDDFRNLRARYKFVVELLEATLLVAIGFRFQSDPFRAFGAAFDLGALILPITVVWIIGITNAVNLIDGMDGLAGGIAALSTGVYGISFILRGDPGAALACFALLGAVLGFLVFNFPPAKIFMGDSGALFLGFTLAVLPLIAPAAGRNEVGFVSAITVLLIPIYDTFAAIIRRTRARVSIFSPDRLHLHHKLLVLGLSNRSALLSVYGAQVLLCAVALSHFYLPSPMGLVLKLGTWVLYAVLFFVVGAVARKRESEPQGDRGDAKLGLARLKQEPVRGPVKTALIGGSLEAGDSSNR